MMWRWVVRLLCSEKRAREARMARAEAMFCSLGTSAKRERKRERRRGRCAWK